MTSGRLASKQALIALVLCAIGCGAPYPEIPEGLPGPSGQALMDYVMDIDPYTEWGTFPNSQWNAYDAPLKSGRPHGKMVRIFVNDIGLESAANGDVETSGGFAAGTIIVKENYSGEDEGDLGELTMLTIMYKMKGYDAWIESCTNQGNDWFWAKGLKDGSIAKVDIPGGTPMELSGKMDAQCQNCHIDPYDLNKGLPNFLEDFECVDGGCGDPYDLVLRWRPNDEKPSVHSLEGFTAKEGAVDPCDPCNPCGGNPCGGNPCGGCGGVNPCNPCG